MGDWNFGEAWEVVARVRGEQAAIVQGDRSVSWASFERRAGGVAATLQSAGLQAQAKVAQYLYNSPEYLESMFASYKAGLAPVNTNYRYLDDELSYLWQNGDVEAVILHGSFVERADRVRRKLPGVRLWLWVDDGAGQCPGWAVPYEEAAAAAPRQRHGAANGDDALLVYTGGTTGLPKGVVWRQDDYLGMCNVALGGLLPRERDLDTLEAVLAAPGPILLPASPLMHGNAMSTSHMALLTGGTVVLLPSRSFDAYELLETIARQRVDVIMIVGDVIANGMLHALDAQGDRFDLSSLQRIASAGMMWSEATKAGLLRHLPDIELLDALGSTEVASVAVSQSVGGTISSTGSFTLAPSSVVLDDDDAAVEPGSGRLGRIAAAGPLPLGYYKDPEKTKATFPTVNGKRYCVTGDYATVELDGTIRLLGRGSVCINTGGEKVFPEEVEEVLKELGEVLDAAVVGVPDERWGEAVTAAIVWMAPAPPDETLIVAHVKERLAGYKVPRRIIFVDSVGRGPNGKIDYPALRAALASPTSTAP